MPMDKPINGKNNKILLEKESAEELDDNNQKWLQKFVRNFLYYARAIYPKMSMTLK